MLPSFGFDDSWKIGMNPFGPGSAALRARGKHNNKKKPRNQGRFIGFSAEEVRTKVVGGEPGAERDALGRLKAPIGTAV